MKKMNKKMKIILLTSLIAIISISGFFTYKYIKHQQNNEIVYIEIEAGDTVSKVISKIEDAEVDVSSKKLLKEFNKLNAQVYPNYYELRKNMSAREIVEILNNPQSNVKGDKLVIIEGDNINNVAKNLADKSNGRFTKQQILDFWNNRDNLNKWIEQYWFLTDEILNKDILYPLEGYFAPATYTLINNFSLEDITTDFFEAMDKNLAIAKDENVRQGFTIHQLLTLASIVERESFHQEDLPKIAGVLYNRLEINMPLQCDITVLYAQQNHKEKVLYKDLEVESPYNTYKRIGLPPGPIAMVSKNAIEAVINPEDNDYLYFFALQDSGDIIYSKTLEEHEKVSQENAWK